MLICSIYVFYAKSTGLVITRLETDRQTKGEGEREIERESFHRFIFPNYVSLIERETARHICMLYVQSVSTVI